MSYAETLRAMNENPPPHDSPRRDNPNLPPVGKGVRVRHQGRECFAYLDGQGKWRNYDNGNLLDGEVTILSALPFSTY
jgi:hypothetical protein